MPRRRPPSDGSHTSGIFSWKRCLGFTCVGLLSVFGSGCPSPLPLQPPPILSHPMPVPQAQQLLKETLLRSLNPEILEVEVSADFVVYRYRRPIAVSTTKPLTEQRIALLNIGRVEAFANNVVLIWTPSNILLGQLIFGNYEDPRTCASLLLFLRDQRSLRSAR
ncbi:MAG: hypothetical protein AB7N91_20095 [Candidatus Tectimicrobiota bacterium]